VGDNSAVPHHTKSGLSKELLHEVNNQLEIVMFAAELLSQHCLDPSTKERCEQIQSAVFRTSNLLKTYFKGAIPIQPAPDAVSGANSPVVADRL
jgi:nitrogen-specific signal transduction histidine kinase